MAGELAIIPPLHFRAQLGNFFHHFSSLFLFLEEREENMPFEPSALYLQEFYLNPKNHHRLDDWLMGKHYLGTKRKMQNAEIQFVELTPNELSEACVLKAISKTNAKNFPLENKNIQTQKNLGPYLFPIQSEFFKNAFLTIQQPFFGYF